MDNREKNEEQNDLENPLGIAGTPVTPDAPEHLRASDDEEEVRRRRKRAMAAENDEPDSTGTGMGDVNFDHKGATGIDLGAERGTK